jgi:hypothetical protein
MKRLAFGLLGLICGYILGAVAGYAIVTRASANTHDKTIEAAMTGAFVSGPLGAITGAVAGLLLGRRG